jgi:hypothetical protein
MTCPISQFEESCPKIILHGTPAIWQLCRR